MIDENEAAQAEGEAVPRENAWHRVEDACESVADRAIAAVERWYSAHFHKGQTTGSPVISSDDKAALIASVSAELTPKE